MEILYCKVHQDTYDPRDHKKEYDHSEIPTMGRVDMRHYVHRVYDQGKLCSCTANAVCAAYGFDLTKQSQTLDYYHYYYFDPSRLFVYYNTREYEGTTWQDSGASLRDTVKAFKRKGVCDENLWPYDVSKFSKKPPRPCYNAAQGNNIKYERLKQDIDQFRACLHDNCPFVFGFKVYWSFNEIGKDGVMPMPTYKELLNEPESRHAVMAVGYDDEKKHIIVLNSWGTKWGRNGYFYMPYKFIVGSSMCFDFWKISFACERPRCASSTGSNSSEEVAEDCSEDYDLEPWHGRSSLRQGEEDGSSHYRAYSSEGRYIDLRPPFS